MSEDIVYSAGEPPTSATGATDAATERSLPLTDQQLRVMATAPFWGLRPGDNMWPHCDLRAPDTDEVICPGEDVDALIRIGLLHGEEMPEARYPVARNEELGVVEFRWRYWLTQAGRAALAPSKPENV